MIPITVPAKYSIKLIIVVLLPCLLDLDLAVLIPSNMQVTVKSAVMIMEAYIIGVWRPDAIETANEIRIIASDISAE